MEGGRLWDGHRLGTRTRICLLGAHSLELDQSVRVPSRQGCCGCVSARLPIGARCPPIATEVSYANVRQAFRKIGEPACAIPRESKPEYIDAWLNADPRNLEAQYAVFDDRVLP
jgi:hypothetical protein